MCMIFSSQNWFTSNTDDIANISVNLGGLFELFVPELVHFVVNNLGHGSK